MNDTLEDLLASYGDDLDRAIDEEAADDLASPDHAPRRRGALVGFAAACLLVVVCAGALFLTSDDSSDIPAAADGSATMTDPMTPPVAIEPLFGAQFPSEALSTEVRTADGTPIRITVVTDLGSVPTGLTGPEVCAVSSDGFGPCIYREMGEGGNGTEFGVSAVGDMAPHLRNQTTWSGMVAANVDRLVVVTRSGDQYPAATTPVPRLSGLNVFRVVTPSDDPVVEVEYYSATGAPLQATCASTSGWTIGGQLPPGSTTATAEPSDPTYVAQLEALEQPCAD